MLVEEVYAIGSKELERGLSHLLDILQSAIQRSGSRAEPSSSKTECACDDDLVAEGRERFADELFVFIWAGTSAVSNNASSLS